MLKDLITGTIGVALFVVLGLTGLVVLPLGLLIGNGCVVLVGFVLLCVAGSIKYALGRIVRLR